MIKNYFKIAWRNLFKNKSSSFINIGGLAIGMAVAMLIGLWIFDELSFNRYHKNYDRIVKVMDFQGWHGQNNTNDVLPVPIGSALQSNYGNDFKYVTMVRETEEHVIASGDKKFTQEGNYMQADAPEMFSLEMIYGSRSGLKDPNSILLSDRLAKKLFGNVDPVGKLVQIDVNANVKVTGVFRDLPNNSEFRTTTFIAPFDLAKFNKTDWGNFNMYIYALLSRIADLKKVSAKIKNLLANKNREQEATHHLFLQPMSKWHLYSAFENHVAVTSEQMRFIWFYGIIGVFVLILACINFMNLSTARSEKRAKEVGIRKAVGSLRRQLIQQFYGESLLISFFAFALSFAINTRAFQTREARLMYTLPASDAFELYANAVSRWGPALQRLKEFNRNVVITPGNAGTLDALSRGEIDMGPVWMDMFYTWQAEGRLSPHIKLELISPGLPGQPMYYVVPDKAANAELARKFVALATSPAVQAEGIVKRFNWYPGIDASVVKPALDAKIWNQLFTDVTPSDLASYGKPFPLAPYFKDLREQYETQVQN